MHELFVQWMDYVVPWIDLVCIVMVLWDVVEAFMGLGATRLVVSDVAHGAQRWCWNESGSETG